MISDEVPAASTPVRDSPVRSARDRGVLYHTSVLRSDDVPCGEEFDHHVPRVRGPDRGDDASGCLPCGLHLPHLRRGPPADAGRLLCLLLLRIGPVPLEAGREMSAAGPRSSRADPPIQMVGEGGPAPGIAVPDRSGQRRGDSTGDAPDGLISTSMPSCAAPMCYWPRMSSGSAPRSLSIPGEISAQIRSVRYQSATSSISDCVTP